MAAAIALALGRDANWDIRNYHLYNPYALLERRWGLDLAPAGLHSFLHPGLDIPFYLLTRSPLNAWLRVVSTLQAGYLGLLIFLTLAVANLACHGSARRATWESMLTAAFGLTGAATLPQAGATFNDVPVACLVVGALLALLVAADCGIPTGHAALQKPRAARLWFLSGVLVGVAVGLKLTAIVYAPALAGAAIFAARGTCVSPARTVAMLALGGALGFIVSFGPWDWFLYEQFGNPFGSYFDDLFHSPWFPPIRQSDPRFLPNSIAQALAYPLLWVRPSVGVVTEETMADPRCALGITGTLLTLGAVSLRRLLRDRDQVRIGSTAEQAAVRATQVVLAFIPLAYAA
ncbi:glycosyltransferase 87 family protein [Belnapia sp. F-4-1]|uniref:glycosyltransferase 87 family protein n=1 Tax=Belnapia sp. F-4-1 TaxID=1545443 RepID=UPI00118686A2|nr:glycosyltransferase 87 family protein [Belnapia sp. F-4-1]